MISATHVEEFVSCISGIGASTEFDTPVAAISFLGTAPRVVFGARTQPDEADRRYLRTRCQRKTKRHDQTKMGVEHKVHKYVVCGIVSVKGYFSYHSAIISQNCPLVPRLYLFSLRR